MIILLFIGIILLLIGYFKQQNICLPNKIEYRYIPRTFEDDQNNTTGRPSQIFRNMFEQPTPWLQGFRSGYVRPNIYKLNQYNIQQ